MQTYITHNDEVLEAANRLAFLTTIIPPKLKSIKEQDFNLRPAPGKWSKKEILGHLIDSATNNHQRFIRIQFEDKPIIYYDQDQWNGAAHYIQYDSRQLIDFWKDYNRFLIELIKKIPEDKLTKTGLLKDKSSAPLFWYITDYVDHLEHHLKQLVNY